MRRDGNLPGPALAGPRTPLPEWFVRVAAAIQEWRELVKQERAFDDLVSRGELDRILDRAGLAAGQLPLVLRAHPRPRILCAAMMRQMGIDPFQPEPRRAMAEVERRCIGCVWHNECEMWLSTSPADADHPPEFCPNAETFGRLRSMPVRPGRTPR